MSGDDTGYMEMALALAEKARGATAPNPLVGAVVVREGRVVGRGYHRAAGSPHAEAEAIDQAGEAARGATLYVTLEPCNHHGRTPPCTEKILASGIRRVVIAMPDPNPDVAGGGAELLRQKGLSVVMGVCERRAARQNDWFLKFVRTKQPFVIAKCAATLDGRIAASSGDARWVTGEASRDFVHRLRSSVDAIMVGRGTVETDDPRLTARPSGGEGRDPIRIVLDTGLAVSPRARVLRQRSPAPTWLVCGPAPDAGRAESLRQAGARLIEAPMREGRIDLAALMVLLGGEGVTSLLLEGGAGVMGAALRAGIVDKVCFFYAPKLTAGDDGVPMCAGPGAARMADCIPVREIEVRRFGDDVMIEGYIHPPQPGPR